MKELRKKESCRAALSSLQLMGVQLPKIKVPSLIG